MYLLAGLLSRFNKLSAPYLLRFGISLRHALDQNIGSTSGGVGVALDALCGLPLTQKIISIEVQNDVRDKQKHERAAERMKSLEHYVRNALMPSGVFGDVSRWRYNLRFVMWLRREYFLAKHREDVVQALSFLPQLKSKSLDVRKPVPMHDLTRAFRLSSWTRRYTPQSETEALASLTHTLGGTMMDIPHSSVSVPRLDPGTPIDHLPLGDAIELGSGHVANCGSFNLYCEVIGIYEVWTREYIEALSSYLLERSKELDGSTVIVEVGAGDGLLSYFLNECLQRKGQENTNDVIAKFKSKRGRKQTVKQRKKTSREEGTQTNDYVVPQIVATDDGSWKITPYSNASVESLSVSQAISKHGSRDTNHELTQQKHVIVLCSWMPMGEDWTEEFRNGGVAEYILIGEKDDGNCGDNWKTWGNPDFCFSSQDTEGEEMKHTIPHEMDGYERNDLNHISKLQFSRFDSSKSRNSHTVSFKKVQL